MEPNAEARLEKERELELKLILGSNYQGWNISENIIAEKNLSNEPWEFGYAVGASRPLSLAASAHNCTFCGEKFQAGVEMYGGLGDRYSFGTIETSHYLGPLLNWSAPNGMTFSFSPQFGLNDYSIPRLYRFGVSVRNRPTVQPISPGCPMILGPMILRPKIFKPMIRSTVVRRLPFALLLSCYRPR